MIDIEKLKAQHQEELKDAEMYEAMADEHPEWKRVLHDIAHDERQHADMIKHMIEHHNH